MFRYLLHQRVKFGSSLCQINRMRQLLGTRTLGNVTYALVVSKLYFCSPVWSSSSKKNISKLQKVQNFKNFNARIITNTWKFDHITAVLQELRWLPVSYYLIYTVDVLAFKCAKGLAPTVVTWVIAYWQDLLFMIATQEITTILIFIPAYQSAAGQRTFLYREQLNSGTHCHVRSLRQTTCVLSKRNFENSFLNHFWSAKRDTYFTDVFIYH